MSFFGTKLFGRKKTESNRPSIWTLKTTCCPGTPPRAPECCAEENIRRNGVPQKTLWSVLPSVWDNKTGHSFNSNPIQ